MSGDKSKPTLGCLNDTATGEDSLGFKPYVEAITEFLTSEGTLPPITLSIEGEWGCGKSSFMKQLQKEICKKSEIKKEPKYFTVWFNCWRYEKEDELWAAFALSLMEQLSEQVSWVQRLLAQLKLRYLRLEFKWKSKNSISLHILFFIFAVCILSYSIAKFVNILYFNSINRPLTTILVTLTGIIGPTLPIFYFWKDIKEIFGNPFDFSKFASNPNYMEHISFIEHFHSDFSKIIKSYAGNSRVYVFIDDLDRCEIPKAAELMQALNLMISDEANIYFSIGMDRKIISAGLAAKNEQILKYLKMDRPENSYGLEYGYDFIEKFIQLPFKVPSPKSADFLNFLTSAYGTKIPLNSSETMDKLGIYEYLTLTRSSEGDLKSSKDENSGKETGTTNPNNMGTESNKQKIQNDNDCMEDEISKLILEMVAHALDNNPRRIKQFINQFRFQRTIGKRTGLFSYKGGTAPENIWNCKKLAKFVAISIQWPLLISALSSNITLLEQIQEYALEPKIEYKKSEKETEVIEEENKNLEKWTKDEKLMRLLKYGCVEGGNISKEAAEYTLSGLDFSKLLQISPVIVYSQDEVEFVIIPKEGHVGKFMMGSPNDEAGRENFEDPLHEVTIRKPFYLGKYPVTQRQWIAVMGNNPSRFKGDDLPVESVSWNSVQEFIRKLNKMEGTNKYRLPSEAEWEYACRAGTTTRYSFGDDEEKLNEYAWYLDNSGPKTHPVGQKNPNPWGLYDMHGNVWEWVQDEWRENYESVPSDGSAWEGGDISKHVIRGGGRNSYANKCRSANRYSNFTSDRFDYVGFRLLKEL